MAVRSLCGCLIRYEVRIFEVSMRQPSVMSTRHMGKFDFLKRKKSKADVREENSIVTKSQFLFEMQDKTKENFLEFVEAFVADNPNRRGHVEFIYACIKNIDDFGLSRDLATFKRLMDVFPKGKMIASNSMLAELMYYPRQQQCAIDLLQKMEDFGVIPDLEMHDIIVNAFGKRSYVFRRYSRMMYWMPKFKNASPWPLPKPVPDDALELALLAIKRINTVDLQSVTTVHQTSEVEDAIDGTWIVSAQSPTQRELIDRLPIDKPISVDGAFRVWLRNASIAYFVLRAEPKEFPVVEEDTDDVSNIQSPFTAETEEQSGIVVRRSVHEQEDGTILATCATGTSSRDSLLSWMRILQESNPRLREVPVLFKLRFPSTAIIPANTSGMTDGVDADQPNVDATFWTKES